MKKIISFIVIIILGISLYFAYNNRMIIIQNVDKLMNEPVALTDKPLYHNDFNFELVKETNDFNVKSRQDFLNIMYTVLNNGMTEFNFYCDPSYKDCLKDFDSISKDSVLLGTINNMVSPFNSYDKISFVISNYGKVKVEVTKLYTDDEIKQINEKIDEIVKTIDPNLTDREKIEIFHDYIVNNSSYDKENADRITNGESITNSSHKAIGPLIEGKGLCSGYSDAMKLYLDRLGIPNYKITNENHCWNLVYIDGKWLHLDLTWDDPITSTGDNLLLHKFFLITTDELKNLNVKSHDFNVQYYKETEKA